MQHAQPLLVRRGRRRSEHSQGMPGWDVSFSLQQFVGGREADATIPTFKRCEQAALDKDRQAALGLC